VTVSLGTTWRPNVAFTVLLRLPDGARPVGDNWVDWRYSSQLITQPTYGDPHDDAPYKRYPGTREYFAPQVEGTLFPNPTGHPAESGRWLRRPVALSVTIGPAGDPTYDLRVDLLEVVRVELSPYVAFGIAHLNLAGDHSSAEIVDCSRLLMTRYRELEDREPVVVVRDGSDSHTLMGHVPLTELTSRLFGAAHAEVAHQAYSFAATKVPPDVDPGLLPAWRRAVGRGQPLEAAIAVLDTDPEHDDQRNVPLGPGVATFFGRTAGYTYDGESSIALRNVRSYWAETVLFGLIQYSYIEYYARSLSQLGGEPLGREIDSLFLRWLAFRNILWWHHPSFTTDIAERILRRVHRGLRTDRLYNELESGFATYVEARRHDAEEREARAIRSLQVYGAGFAAVSTAAAVMQVLGQPYLKTGVERAISVVGLIIVGIGVITAVSAWLRHRDS